VKIISKILGAVFLAFALALVWREVFPNDPAQIRKMLDGLASALSRSGKASPVSLMLTLDRVRDCFETNVTLSLTAPGVGARERGRPRGTGAGRRRRLDSRRRHPD
jgi:hypothetical protein